ncbi:hypothetical protein [Micromonospora inyonensis]|uniref:Uncharacterized protein n=1 Tax=Micromonospora inyonensis TaxID=47866 RepID=A0A1C6RC64_9ACTN|nr:hypothetical protein [Micromonospora inyonensis]SCL14744.1 hypothetical protein GA0074694_0897 [Micromonospora inyonensis]
MVRTRSHYLTAEPEHRRRVDRELRELLRSHAVLSGQKTLVLPYRTLVLRARRH